MIRTIFLWGYALDIRKFRTMVSCLFVKIFFDVYSFNTYRLSPNMDYVNEVARKIDLPMILGEFHFGTVDRGMAPWTCTGGQPGRADCCFPLFC